MKKIILTALATMVAMLSSIDSHSQSVNELMRKAEKNILVPGAKLEDLVYKKNDRSSKNDPFAPFLVSFSHVENPPWNGKNEYDALHIGFNVNELSQVSEIYYDLLFSYDAFNLLKAKLGMWTSSTGFGNTSDAVASPKTYNWPVKDFVFSLYIDSAIKKQIMFISPPKKLPAE